MREVITAMLPSWAKPRVDEPGNLVDATPWEARREIMESLTGY